MRCAKAHKLIGDFLEQMLPTNNRARLQQHLESCPECRSLLKDFQDIIEQAGDLEEPAPSDENWGKILSKIQAAKRERQASQLGRSGWREAAGYSERRKFAWAAVLILAVVAGGLVLGLRPWQRKGVSGLSPQDKFTVAKLEEAEKHYQLAIRALGEAVASQKGNLDPQVAAVFDQNLKLINSSIQACQNAVRQDPKSLDARLYLLSAYKEKVDVLDSLVDLKKKSPAGNESGNIL